MVEQQIQRENIDGITIEWAPSGFAQGSVSVRQSLSSLSSAVKQQVKLTERWASLAGTPH